MAVTRADAERSSSACDLRNYANVTRTIQTFDTSTDGGPPVEKQRFMLNLHTKSSLTYRIAVDLVNAHRLRKYKV